MRDGRSAVLKQRMAGRWEMCGTEMAYGGAAGAVLYNGALRKRMVGCAVLSQRLVGPQKGEYPTAFPLKHQQKDMRLVRSPSYHCCPTSTPFPFCLSLLSCLNPFPIAGV